MSMNNLLIGVGLYNFYGYSAAFDLIEALSNSSTVSIESFDTIRILLINPGDIRHILCTIAHKNRYNLENCQIEIYLLESPVEILARDCLLLEILNDFDIPIRQRSNVFLEVYGNSKVQERTSHYIEQLGSQLRNLIVKGTGKLESLVDLSFLKYREKDLLEDCFKNYHEKLFPFDMDNYRDYRMRSFYGTRYDNRVALADWDYHESIRSRASIIHIKQFKDWRNSGIAFEFGDQQYSHPNRTFMAYTEGLIKQGKDHGLKKEVTLRNYDNEYHFQMFS